MRRERKTLRAGAYESTYKNMRRYPPSTHGSLMLNGLVERAHEMALAKGWYDEALPTVYQGLAGAPDRGAQPDMPPERIVVKIALAQGEGHEAIECVRDGQLDTWYDEDQGFDELGLPLPAKPEGLPIELADVVIRVADLCGAMGIDLDEAVRVKLAYNETRKHRHGGRAL